MSEPFSRGMVAFDYETRGLDVWRGGAKPFMLGLEDEQGNVLLAREKTRDWDKAMRILADPRTDKVGWNVKYELAVSKKEGIKIGGEVHDAMLMCYMNDEYELDLKLKGVARRHFGASTASESDVKQYLAALKRKDKQEHNYSELPDAMVRKYLEDDLDYTMQGNWKFGHVRTGGQRRVYEIERRVTEHVVEMERWGIHVDLAYCEAMLDPDNPKSLTARKAALSARMFDLAGVRFNSNSTQQLSDILESLNIDTGDRSKRGELVMDKDHLKPFQSNPFVATLLEYRSIQKMDSTYFQPFMEYADKDDVIHPNFWPFGSEDGGIKTGRFSSRNPNFQNIPGSDRGGNIEMTRDPGLVRRAITPRPGYVFLFGDYKQEEFVIFTCGTGSAKLMAEIRAGKDFHVATAELIWGAKKLAAMGEDERKAKRRAAKTINFGILFGQGIKLTAASLGISIAEARVLQAEYFKGLPEAREYMTRSEAALLRDGYVQDAFGRRYHVPPDLAYKAINALCQGPAALVMKSAIPRVAKGLEGLDAHPFITVHDDLGLEVRRDQVWDAAHVLREQMEDRKTFPLPLLVDLAVSDTSWADKLPWEKEASKWKKLTA